MMYNSVNFFPQCWRSWFVSAIFCLICRMLGLHLLQFVGCLLLLFLAICTFIIFQLQLPNSRPNPTEWVWFILVFGLLVCHVLGCCWSELLDAICWVGQCNNLENMALVLLDVCALLVFNGCNYVGMLLDSLFDAKQEYDLGRGHSGVHNRTLYKFIRNNNGSLCSHNEEQTTECYLFARKFSPSALKPLLHLSSKAMGFWNIGCM